MGGENSKRRKSKRESADASKSSTCDQKYENIRVEKATFGMQCFWMIENLFGCIPGIVRTRVGFTGGTTKNPTNENKGDHVECIEIEFDPRKTTYINLLEVFWKNSDTINPQPKMYQSTVFFHTPQQKRKAEETMKENIILHKEPILTKILPAGEFYSASSEHQKYRLQSDVFLNGEFKFDAVQLIRSHVACRLNGYASGDGDIELFELEREELGLSPKVQEYIRKLISSTESA